GVLSLLGEDATSSTYAPEPPLTTYTELGHDPRRGSTQMGRGTVPSPSGTEASLSGMEASPSRVRGKFEGAPASLQGMMRAPSTVLGAPPPRCCSTTR